MNGRHLRCGSPVPGAVPFPPRNELYEIRLERGP
jgi:hypothetical protein